ncbi:MAG: ribose 5-phosphate isomerase A [Acidimicrobiales bacterium]
MSHDNEKRSAAEAAAALVEPRMRLGLGTGSTVAWLLPALARRQLDLVCVATSPGTERAARALGLDIQPFEKIDRLDLAIDGADQVAGSGWLVKGGGGAHTREKIVAHAAERFVVIVSEDKLVPEVRAPVPLELLTFGLPATLRSLKHARQRTAPLSPDRGVIADWWGEIGSPAALAAWLDSQPGVVEHGLFGPDMAAEILVGYSKGPPGTLSR